MLAPEMLDQHQAKEKFAAALRDGAGPDEPRVQALAVAAGLSDVEIYNAARQARWIRGQARSRFRDEVGEKLAGWFDASREDQRRALAGRLLQRADDGTTETDPTVTALQTLLKLDDDAFPAIINDERARQAAIEAEAQERRLVERPPLSVMYPGTRAPVVALKQTKLGGGIIERGQRLDLADYHWPLGKLRRLIRVGLFAPDPDAGPDAVAELEFACVRNGGFIPPVTPSSVTERDESPEDRKRRLARERQQRARLRKKQSEAIRRGLPASVVDALEAPAKEETE